LTLDGAFNASEDERRGWIEESANAVAEFFHGFPVQRAALMVVPVPDHLGVLHGKVVPAGGAGIALLMGEHTPRYRLYRDWILVHELFHLGFPSFWKEGKWLDEGLATYYEPIIRARAGWRSENSVWREFAHEMPQAVPALELGGLENTSDHGAIYWGGALLSLMADAETRRKSGGKLGLEDGVRGLIAAGADATQVWDLEHAIRIIDAQLGDSTLQQLASDHAVDGSPLDFDRTLHRLGVHRTDHGVILADDAPLSTVRRSMIRSQ
jgi:hypothetical protein